jgi:hypothetical protein
LRIIDGSWGGLASDDTDQAVGRNRQRRRNGHGPDLGGGFRFVVPAVDSDFPGKTDLPAEPLWRDRYLPAGRSDAQVGFSDMIVAGEILSRIGHRDFTIFQYIASVDRFKSLANILFGYQNGD